MRLRLKTNKEKVVYNIWNTDKQKVSKRMSVSFMHACEHDAVSHLLMRDVKYLSHICFFKFSMFFCLGNKTTNIPKDLLFFYVKKSELQ